MMSVVLRALLVICSIACFLYVMRKVRKTQMKIEDSLFWIVFSIFIVLIGVFPQIMIKGAIILGVDSPVNFVYLVIIFILIIKCFSQSIRFSHLDSKLTNLIQQIAILEKNKEESAKRTGEK